MISTCKPIRGNIQYNFDQIQPMNQLENVQAVSQCEAIKGLLEMHKF